MTRCTFPVRQFGEDGSVMGQLLSKIARSATRRGRVPRGTNKAGEGEQRPSAFEGLQLWDWCSMSETFESTITRPSRQRAKDSFLVLIHVICTCFLPEFTLYKFRFDSSTCFTTNITLHGRWKTPFSRTTNLSSLEKTPKAKTQSSKARNGEWSSYYVSQGCYYII